MEDDNGPQPTVPKVGTCMTKLKGRKYLTAMLVAGCITAVVVVLTTSLFVYLRHINSSIGTPFYTDGLEGKMNGRWQEAKSLFDFSARSLAGDIIDFEMYRFVHFLSIEKSD